MKIKFILFVFVLSFISLYSQNINTPNITFLQGFLTDNEGAPVENILSAKVFLYDSQGNSIGICFNDNIEIVKGYFSIPITLSLDDLSVVDLKNSFVEAEIEIDGKEFEPRIKFGTALYSKLAQTADSSLSIRDYAITDKKIATDAAIDGKKINPNFGDQKISTSDTVEANYGNFRKKVYAKVAKFDYLDMNDLTLSSIRVDTLEVKTVAFLNGSTKNNIADSSLLFSDIVHITKDLIVHCKSNLNDLKVNERLLVAKSITGSDSLIIHGFAIIVKDLKLKGKLEVDEDSYFRKNIKVDGRAELNNGLDLKGILNLDGSLETDSLQVNEYTILNDLEVNGQADFEDLLVKGDLEVNNNSLLHKKLTVEGVSNLSETNIYSNLKVSERITTNDIEVLDSARFNRGIIVDTMLVEGQLIVDGKISGKGNMILSSDKDDPEDFRLYVNGKTYFKDGVFADNLTLKKNLTVHGKATFDTLDVIDIASINILTVQNETQLNTTTINGILNVNDSAYFKDANFEHIQINQNLNVDGNTTLKQTNITGSINVSDSTITRYLKVRDDIQICGNLTVKGQTELKDKLIITNGGLDIIGDSKLTGNLDLDGNLIVSNTTTTNNLNVNGQTNIKNLLVDGTLEVNDTTLLHNNLKVEGESNLKQTSISGNLAISQKTTTKDLAVSDSAIFNSGIVSGDMTVTGKLTVDGRIEGKGKMVLSSASSIPDPGDFQLYVDGKTYFEDGVFADDLTLNNNLTVNGRAIFDTLNVTDIATIKDLAVTDESQLNTTTINGILNVNADAKFQNANIDNLQIDHNLNVDGNTTLKQTNVTGNIYVSETTNTKHLKVDEDIQIDGDLKVNGQATLNDKLTITDGGLDVKGNSKLTGDFQLLGNLDVNNSLTTKDLDVSGQTNIKDLLVDGTLEVKQNTTLRKELIVEGKSNLAQTNINEDLSVTQKTTTNELEVTNIADLKNGVITGNMNVTGELSVDGLIKGKGKMVLSSTPPFPNPIDYQPYQLYVEGKTYFQEGILAGELTIDNTLTVTGTGIFENLQVNQHSNLNNLVVTGTTNLNSTIIDGDLRIESPGSIYVEDGNLSVNGVSALGYTTTPTSGMASGKILAVNGESYFGDVLYGNNISLNEGDGRLIAKTINIDGDNSGDVVALNSNAIQGYEIESNNNENKIIVDNIRKTNYVKDEKQIGPENTHLHNLAIAIWRYIMSNPEDEYSGDDLKDDDDNSIFDSDGDGVADNGGKRINNIFNDIYNNYESNEFVENIFNAVGLDIENSGDQIIIRPSSSTITKINIDAPEITLGCLDIECTGTETILDSDVNIVIGPNHELIRIGCLEIDCSNTFSTIKRIDGNTVYLNNENYLNTIVQTIIKETKLTNITLESSTFSNSYIENTELNNTDINNSNIYNTTLEGSTFSNSYFENHVDLSNADVKFPDPSEFKNVNIFQDLVVGNKIGLNGNMGIGTTPDPNYGLNVDGKINCTDLHINGQPFNSSNLWEDDNNGIHYNSGNVGIGTNSTSNRLTVGGKSFFNGNVGIGTTPSGYRLDVSGNSLFSSDVRINGNVGIGSSPTGNPLLIRGNQSGPTVLAINSNGYTAGEFTGSGNNDYVLSAWANNPFAMGLQVNGESLFWGEVQIGGTGSGSYNLILYGSGKIGIGTSSPSYPLSVVSSNNTAIEGYITVNDYGSAAIRGQSTTNSYGGYFQSPWRALYCNGPAGGNGGWNNWSDSRLKKFIKIIPNSLERVMKLKGVEFYWKDTTIFYSKKKQIGFLAQEAKSIVPEVVNFDGKYYTMEYAQITALLVEAMKEQQRQIEELAAEVNALKENEKVHKVENDNIIETLHGKSTLINGSVEIDLIKKLQYIIQKSEFEFSVQLTPRGNCNGLYVEEINYSKLIVKELQNGKSNIEFDYQIILIPKENKNDKIAESI